ncbi:MAG: amidohydrolase family protein [Acidimicrobiales bacterium]|jgi:predicted TIM-barrel fold metal-dependent hydrolase
MPSRTLDFPVFDADNHMYETRDALTKFLPERYARAIDYVDIHGRTKIMIRGQVSEYIPNPTFDVVAAPGAQEEYFRNGNPEGKSYRELVGDPIRCLPAFREPAPRIELMDELGIDRALMFPTLASLIEERMKDDPELIHTVMHALNQWMHETWTFAYEDRIFATPVINMGIIDRALEELEWVLERGARCVLIRPAPVPGLRGTRSPGLPEFDPVWSRIVEAGILVGMHASDSGYAEIANWWEESSEFLPFRPSAFRMMAQGKRPIYDTMAALICHGALSRFPDLRIAAVENGANWVAPLLHDLADTYEKVPTQFAEEPTAAFRRNIYVNPFWEDDMSDLAELVGADHILFGSDYPHPEGLRDPISYVDELKALDDEDTAKIMGGNLAGLMGVGVPV